MFIKNVCYFTVKLTNRKMSNENFKTVYMVYIVTLLHGPNMLYDKLVRVYDELKKLLFQQIHRSTVVILALSIAIPFVHSAGKITPPVTCDCVAHNSRTRGGQALLRNRRRT